VRDSARAAQIAAALNARLGFAVLLRDGFALAAADGNEPFAKLAEGALRVVLADFAGLGVHRDVPEGVRILRRHGLRLVTLTNGSADVADGLLTRAGLRGEFQGPLSVEDAAAWKPVPVAYAHAARACSVSTEQICWWRCVPGISTARTRRA
jgi:2-haloacid dehalogenase